MALEQGLKRSINRIADLVRMMYNVEIPIKNVDEVVERIGGIVIESDVLSEYSDGFIRKVDDDSFEIVVSSSQPPVRKNFTIAHELGHLFLHMGFLSDSNEWERQTNIFFRKGNSHEENMANEFAAAFLMPREEYKEIMDKYTKGNFVDTKKIARYFNVSENAAANRGKWLGYLEW